MPVSSHGWSRGRTGISFQTKERCKSYQCKGRCNIVNSNGIANRYLLSIFSHAMCIAIICISIAIIPKESSSKLEKYLCKTVNDGIKGHNHEV